MAERWVEWKVEERAEIWVGGRAEDRAERWVEWGRGLKRRPKGGLKGGLQEN